MGFRRILGALTVAVALSACGGIMDPSKNTMDTITGTIPVGGADFKQFSTSKNGEVQVTISSLSPTPSNGALMGIALGQFASGSCAVFGNYVTTFIVGPRRAVRAARQRDLLRPASLIPGRLPSRPTIRVSSRYP